MSDTFLHSLKSGAADIYSGFKQGAKNAVAQKFTERTGVEPRNNIGENIFSLLYASARKRTGEVVSRLRSTGTGRKLEAEALKQRIGEELKRPVVWLIVGAAVLIIFALARATK